MIGGVHWSFVTLVVGIALIAGYFQVTLLWRNRHLRWPLWLHLAVLASPVLSLLVLILGLCYPMLPPLDGHLIDDHSITLMAVITLGSLGLLSVLGGLVSLATAMVLIRRYPKATDPYLEDIVQRIAAKLAIPSPSLRIFPSTNPVSFICGVRGLGRQCILLSSWFIDNLDEEELEAVIAHELAHAKNRDNLMSWLATFFRNAVFYLPPYHTAHHLFEMERELSADRAASKVTGSPLALASALAKVIEQQWSNPYRQRTWLFASSFLPAGWSKQGMKERLQNLIEGGEDSTSVNRSSHIAAAMPFGLLIAQLGAVLALYRFFCCPGSGHYIPFMF